MNLRVDGTLNLDQQDIKPFGFALNTYIQFGPKGRKTDERGLSRELLKPRTQHADQVVLMPGQAVMAKEVLRFVSERPELTGSMLWQTMTLRRLSSEEVTGLREREFFDFIHTSVQIFEVSEPNQQAHE